MNLDTILQGDCLEVLKTLPDQSVGCCITSPPYFGLRDYGVEGQIGLEASLEDFILKITEVFREVRRVLKEEGTLWLNLGDSYNSGNGFGPQGIHKEREGFVNHKAKNRMVKRWGGGNIKVVGLKPKDLMGVPWRVAFALQADGWYLRQDIIWAKPNPMPESVTDRCTKSHEYVFLLSKSSRYYFDNEAIREPLSPSKMARLAQDVEKQQGSDRVPGKTNGPMKAVKRGGTFHDHSDDLQVGQRIKTWVSYPEGANKRSVWTVPTMPFAEAHFATFPEKLIAPMIKAGCPGGGIVLDPFMGAGTTALVAQKLNRHYLGIELNPEYIKMAEKRLKQPVLL